MRQTGLIGTGASASSMVPTPKTPNAVAGYAERFRDEGEVVNPDIWSRYSAALRRPTTFDSMLELYEEMSSWDLLAAALVEIVDEALQTDETFPDPIRFECNDAEYEDKLNEMLVRIDAAEMLPSQTWYTAGFGNAFEKLHYAREKGVMGLSFIHPMDVRRYWLERNRQCIGYRIRGRTPDKESAYADAAGNPIQRMQIAATDTTEELWHPWDVMHFRRLYRSRFHEHGEPIFEEAQGIYKKLRMAIDQMVVFRAQIQPDRYVVNLDVAELPPADQFRMVQKWKQSLRSKLSFGPGSNGSSPNEFSAFYQAWGLDTIMWMARPKGMTHSVEKLAGTTQVPDVYDIEMLQNLLFSILGMPKWWVMGQSGQSSPPSGKALLASDIRFLRKVKAVRKPLMQGYTWLGYFHALLQGKNTSELDIRAVMPPIGSLEDQAKMETLQAQTGVLQSFADVMTSFNLPREAWIDVIFKRYMHLPDDVVNVFMTALPPEVEMQQEGWKPKKSDRPVRAIIQELDKMVGKDPRVHRAQKLLNEVLAGKKMPQAAFKHRLPHQILWGPMAESGEERTGPKLLTEAQGTEWIRSSYGMNEADPAICKTPGELALYKKSIQESEQGQQPKANPSSAKAPSRPFTPRKFYGPRTG